VMRVGPSLLMSAFCAVVSVAGVVGRRHLP
jgi:hypothetical protein